MQKSTPPSAGDHCRLTAPRALRLHGAVATRGGRVSRRTLARWILRPVRARARGAAGQWFKIETNSTLRTVPAGATWRSEEHTSELQSLMRISYAVFCLKKKTEPREINYHAKM